MLKNNNDVEVLGCMSGCQRKKTCIF